MAYVLAIYVLLFSHWSSADRLLHNWAAEPGFVSAAHDSAFNAAKCKSFLTNISSSEPSAKTVAESSALRQQV